MAVQIGQKPKDAPLARQAEIRKNRKVKGKDDDAQTADDTECSTAPCRQCRLEKQYRRDSHTYTGTGQIPPNKILKAPHCRQIDALAPDEQELAEKEIPQELIRPG